MTQSEKKYKKISTKQAHILEKTIFKKTIKEIMKKKNEILIGGSIFILGMLFLASAVFIIKIGSGL